MKPSLSKKIKNIVYCGLAVASLMTSGSAFAQEQISQEEYDRAISFRYEDYYNKKAFHLHTQVNWFADSTGLWYLHQSPEAKSYVKLSLPSLEKSELFEQDKLASILTELLGKKIEATDLPIRNLEYKSPSQLQMRIENKTYVLDTNTYKLEEVPVVNKDPMQANSPDTKWVAYTKDYNLYIKSKETGAVKQLSKSGEEGYEYASYYGWADIMEGENAKRPERFSVEWSEDSKWLYANIVDLRTAEKMYLLDWSIDSLYRPKLLSYFRGSPGDSTMVYVEPVFFNIETGKEIKVDLPKTTHINSTKVTWSKTPGKVYLEYTTRGFQNKTIYSLDLNTEKLEVVYTESSKTNIDNFDYRFVEDSGRMFFLSQKSGWRQLYSLDLKTKKEVALTKGAYFINSILRIDEKAQKLYFLASGKEDGRNPYLQHLYSISFNGKNLKLLSPENQHHQISMSPDNKYVVDNYSGINNPTTTVLRSSSTGEVLSTITTADISRLGNRTAPEEFTATASDGKTIIYGALWKPSNFDASKTYPIIDYTYTGPHTQITPKSFQDGLGQQALAELGFVVVIVDGLGSTGRSKKFQDHTYGNLGKGLEDHIIAIKQLGEKYSWIDTNRVGIYGHSAGGYDTGRALLAYPDFYKVGVSSAGNHDHRMEKAWWPEMYMGWPVGAEYHEQSNVTMAANLKGKLLLVHGGIDENVNPSSTFKLAEALIKANKQFDMLILPSQRHGFSGAHSKYFNKVRWNYFIKHLRGLEPIWDFE